jgi:hypothetical protein
MAAILREFAGTIGSVTTKGSDPMPIVERSTNRLVVESAGVLGAFNIALDKEAGTARIERKTLMWNRRPREIPLTDIKDFSVASLKDAASGAELRKLSLRTQGGEVIELPVEEKAVDEIAAALRQFIGLAA